MASSSIFLHSLLHRLHRRQHAQLPSVLKRRRSKLSSSPSALAGRPIAAEPHFSPFVVSRVIQVKLWREQRMS
ncbi:hypothetical protein PVAP13_5KG348507 [Panicum virgatum]|uniref:Uncharacterized protein n=1 Tax=Panicum virgatum TaxID=38727 RepID=A0A8T0SFF2_PANVG|nr:hypothetical protein PVAP13_5KG348507 [Panicum virgatum]